MLCGCRSCVASCNLQRFDVNTQRLSGDKDENVPEIFNRLIPSLAFFFTLLLSYFLVTIIPPWQKRRGMRARAFPSLSNKSLQMCAREKMAYENTHRHTHVHACAHKHPWLSRLCLRRSISPIRLVKFRLCFLQRGIIGAVSETVAFHTRENSTETKMLLIIITQLHPN